MDEEALQAAILQHVLAPGYRPVKPRKIADHLKLDEAEARQLKKQIRRLVKQGKLAYASGHAVLPPGKESTDRVTGTFRRMPAGFGFVRLQRPADGADPPPDIFVAAKNARDAASGDTVLVRLQGKRGSKRGLGPAGEIIEVLDRGTHRFVGTYFEQSGIPMVQIDGKVFSAPVRVGDASSSEVETDEKVVVEMVRFPSHAREGEAVIVEVLGARNQPGVDTLSIIHEYGLPGDFPESVLEEARSIAETFDASIPPDRTDLTGLTVVTIDPIDARDFDDAISLERTDEGHWRLGVHIADVSHFVQEESQLDREAYERSTSAYLPDRVIPMLPETISNHLASLQPEQVRYTRSVLIEMTAEGVVVDVQSLSAAIRSDRRFHYEEVDEFLASPVRWKKKLTPEVHRLLLDMHTLAMVLRRRRLKRGALELNMPEVKIELDRKGRVAGAHVAEHTESHQVIEEFMLAANEAIAAWLHAQEIPFLRRIHESPEPRKLRALTQFVEELEVETSSLESRFALQRLLRTVEGRREQQAVNYALLRSLKRAVYSPLPVGHFALASDHYCHFTSPIRRYPDLLIHRLLRTIEQGRKPKQKKEQVHAIGEHCSEREQRAEKAERELVKVKLLHYLSDQIGKEMDATVTGVQDYGLFAQGIELPAEGLIHIASLAEDHYQLDARAHTLAGRRRDNTFRLGDTVRVAVAHVDIDRRELDFRFIERPRRGKQGSRQPPKKGPARGTGRKRSQKKVGQTQRPEARRGKKKSRRRRDGGRD